MLDDPAAPTRCVAGGVAVDNDGRKICHRNDSYELGVGGGVHGFTVGKSTRGDDATVDLFLVYTGGVDLAGGVSWIRKVTVRVRRNGGADAEHTVTDSAEWGGELWRDSVADIRAQSSNRTMGPYGVGCDHAWVDESGDHVWVTTFRQPSDGIHMLEYDTGKLVYSVTGFATQTSPAPDGCYYGRCPDGYYANYSYAAGLSGRGALGAPGSVVTLATSQNYPTARVGGKGSVWYVDISTAWPRRQARGV